MTELHRSGIFRHRLVFLFVIGAGLSGLTTGWADPPSADGQALWQRLEKYTEPPAEFAGKFGSYRSPLKFDDGSLVKTPEDWSRRRKELLAKWTRRLGAWPPLVERPTMKRLESVEREGYVQYHVHMQ